MNQRMLVGIGIGVAAVAMLLLALLIAQDTGDDPEAPRDSLDVPEVSTPEVPAAPQPAPRFTRVPVPAPVGVDRPDAPTTRPQQSKLEPDEYRAMNYAMDDVIRGAREECIRPWIDTRPEPIDAEFVFDAVLYDGRMYDFGLRSLTSEVPGDVMDCMRDQAWYGEWPDFDLRGELTLQRKIEVENQASLDLSMLLPLTVALASAAPSVVVVPSPGLAVEAYAPLVTELRDAGIEPHVVGLPCAGSTDDLQRLVRAAVDAHVRPVVLADGVGATLALQAGGDVSRYVLLGPVLDVVPVAATTWLAQLAVGAAVDLQLPLQWSGRDVREVVLGAPLPPLACVAPSLATEVQGWVRDGHVPLDLQGVDAPVWVGVGLFDTLAPHEAVVSASRLLPRRTLVRLGLTRLDPQDYDHAGLLREPAPVRAAVQAVLEEGS